MRVPVRRILERSKVGLAGLGVASNTFSAPNAAALQITTDIGLWWIGKPALWAQATTMGLLGRYGAGGSRSYRIALETTGAFSLYFTPDGTTVNQRTTASAVPFAPGAVGGIGVTLDVDNGAAGHTITFYVSHDQGRTWLQYHQIVVGGTTSIFAGAEDLQVASTVASGQYLNGITKRAQVRAGLLPDSPLVADFDPSLYQGGNTLPSRTGELWTLSPSGIGRPSIRRAA